MLLGKSEEIVATDTIGMDQEEEKEDKVSSYLFLFSRSHLSSRAPNLSLFMNLAAVSNPPPPPRRSPEGEYNSVYEEWSSLTSPQGLTPQSE